MDINNLMDNVRSFFTEQYKNIQQTDTFISFEPLGCMIDPSDFADADPNLSKLKATEQLSILGDRLPEIKDTFLPDTSRLSSLYEMLVESASFTGAKLSCDDKTDYIARFSEVRSASLSNLSDSKKASITTPEGTYLPVHGLPERWYDPQSPFWISKTFSATEPPGNTQSVQPVSKPLFMGWRTKIATDPNTLSAVSNIALASSQTRNISSPVQPPRAINPENLAGRRPLAVIQLPHLNGRGSDQPPAAPPPAAGPHPMLQINNLSLLRNISLAGRVSATRSLVHSDPSDIEPVQSNELSMSFDYCIVYLDRPWYDTSLFHYSNLWYSLSLKEDYFSNGNKDDSNSGVFKCVTSAMILIKNLKIKAAWTDDDKTKAQSSISLGVFNLNGSEFINDELVTPGMQILGWMCEVTPKLPVQNDPNLSS